MFPSMSGHGNMNAGYPSGPGGPPPVGSAPGPGGRVPGGASNSSYFTDKKKGEVNELKNVRVDLSQCVREHEGERCSHAYAVLCAQLVSCCAR